MPSNAISRVIGRQGKNINAIRKLSGAHIEVQSKGQGDKTVIIQVSARATRLANTWISAVLISPDMDLVAIMGKQRYKTPSTLKATVTVRNATTTKMIVTQTGDAITTKSKPTTSTSFDAIAADQDNFGTIPIEPPSTRTLKAAPSKTEAREKEQSPYSGKTR